MILGSGSISFEIVRYLVERFPLLITSGWMDVPCQPITIRNILGYLVGWLDRLLGGIGLHSGRRHSAELRIVDALDFWRVLAVERPLACCF